MSYHSNADVFVQPADPEFPQKSSESCPPSWIQSESKGLPTLKPVYNNQNSSTAALSAGLRPAWSSLNIFKWTMFKRKKEPFVGEQPSYLQSIRPGSGALGLQGDQDGFGGRLQGSGASAAPFEKRSSLLRNLGSDDRNKAHGGSLEEDLYAGHLPNLWSPQSTPDRQVENAHRAEGITSRLHSFQPSRTQDMGNGAATEYSESDWSPLNTGNDHVRPDEHRAHRQASHSDASLLQEQQDREMAEQLLRDEELAASLQDLEIQDRSKSEASLMLAIRLADGLVQDHDAHIRQQTELVEMAHMSQRENDLQELQLQADRELALRLQNESPTMLSDNGLGGEIQNRSRGWRNKRGARRQQTSPKDTLQQASMRPDNGPWYEDEWVGDARWFDNAQRSSSTRQEMSMKDRNEQKSQRWHQPFEDRAYAQQLQEELNQQEQWHIEAQRLQDTFSAEDRQIQANIEAEQAEIKKQEERECLICTEAYDKADMIRPCQHWYCRSCLSSKIPYHWLNATPG